MSADTILFDPSVPQRVSFYEERKGKRYPITNIFAPFDDEEFLRMERAKNTVMKQVEDAETSDAFMVKGNDFQAALDYWDRNCKEIEGYSKDGSLKVDEKLKVQVDPNTKHDAVVNILLFVDTVSNPVADADDPFPIDEPNDDQEVIRVRCLHQGYQLELVHTFSPITIADSARYRDVMAQNYLQKNPDKIGQTEQRIPSKAKPLGDLYDKLIVSVEGYANGVSSVPLHHKVRSIAELFSISNQAITKN